MQGILLLYLELFVVQFCMSASRRPLISMLTLWTDPVSSSSWTERFNSELLPLTPSSSTDGPNSLQECGLAKRKESYDPLSLMIAITKWFNYSVQKTTAVYIWQCTISTSLQTVDHRRQAVRQTERWEGHRIIKDIGLWLPISFVCFLFSKDGSSYLCNDSQTI